MRWPWSRSEPDAIAEPAGLARLGEDDLARLEVVELDEAGTWAPDRRQPAPARPMHEVAYGPARDGTGLAGIWETLAER